MRLFGSVDSSIDRLDRPMFFGGIFDNKWYFEFPTLSRSPSHEHYIDTLVFDPTLRTNVEAGYVISRPRFTRTPKMFEVTYRYISDSDKTSLESLQENVAVGSTSFRWTNPKDSVEYTVRLVEPLKFQMESLHPDYWKVQLKLEQI